MISREEVLEQLDYSQATGTFTWRHSPRCGIVAGCKTTDGYWRIKIRGRDYKAHRLAWLAVIGEWPTFMIDHIDGNKLNNAFNNLRQATNSQNQGNQRRRRGYTAIAEGSGLLYRAKIKVSAKTIHLGRFANEEDAERSYRTAHARFFGEFSPYDGATATNGGMRCS